jgi:hypothetical protein
MFVRASYPPYVLQDIFHAGPRAKLNTLGNMLDIPWNGNVEEWKATIMDRHMKLRTVKFNLRELSLFGVLMSSQKVSPIESLLSSGSDGNHYGSREHF